MLAAVPAGFLSFLIAATAVPARAADSFGGIFTQGKGGLAFRYRLENVYQDSFGFDATASTLRTRLNFKADDLNGFGFVAEYDYVFTVGWDDYNAGGFDWQGAWVS